MLHTDAKSLRDRGDKLFADKRPLDIRNQEIAEHFYPEVAEFTTRRDLGDDFAGHLMSGYPTLVRRDLGDSLGAMLRPKSKQWFHIGADREEKEDHAARSWLDWCQGVQKRAMYDGATGFTRAVKEGDHAFATFGAAIISIETNRRDNTLLYRHWHWRDVAWSEDSYGMINQIHRNWSPTVTELCYYFPKTVSDKVKERKEKEPLAKVKVRQIVLRSDEYSNKKFSRFPWVCMFIDVENDVILEEVGSWTRKFIIPRWATVPGSQYPCSPATVVALPDARLLQAQIMTVLEAGEKAVNPPMIGVSEALRSDLDLRAGGFTAVDRDYDEKLGEVLRPMTIDKSGLPFGLEMADRTSSQIMDAFYISKLNMPPAGGPNMTAFEVGQRVQEHIRQVLPLFEPMEDEYNGALCDMTFETLMREGAFGAMDQIPESIRGEDVRFTFESPLADMVERQKGQTLLEAKAMLAEVLPMDQGAVGMMDFRAALRDTLKGIGVPTNWTRSDKDLEAEDEERQRAAQAQQMLNEMGQSSEIAQNLGQAAQSFDQVAA